MVSLHPEIQKMALVCTFVRKMRFLMPTGLKPSFAVFAGLRGSSRVFAEDTILACFGPKISQCVFAGLRGSSRVFAGWPQNFQN